MRKIRILALVLAVLMLPLATLFGCNDTTTTEQGGCANGEHKFPNKMETIQKKTCTQPEIKQKTCRECGYFVQEITAEATGHVFDDENRISANDATCLEDGHFVTECTWCTEVKIEDAPGSALGHKFVHYVTQPDGYSELAYCANCNQGTDERLLGITLDMEGDRTHLSYSAMSTFTGGDDTLASYIDYNGGKALQIKRNAGDVVGKSDFGVVLAPRTSVLENVKFAIEFEIVLKDAKDVTLTGNKAYGNQTMDFVTYDAAEKTINSAEGKVYAVTDADLNGIKIAVVFNDAKLMYDMYVNNALVAGSVPYIDAYYNGFGINTFEIKMAQGNEASTFVVDNIKLYVADKPLGYEGDVKIDYDYYEAESGELITIKTLDEACDHVFTTEVKANGCASTSYTIKTCTLCRGQRVTKESAPSAHMWTFSHTTLATCWDAGYECNVCSVCGAKDGKVISPKLSHELGADATVVPPSCTTIGYTEGNCVNCGFFYYDESSEVEPLGHELGEDATVVVPTCTEEGYTIGNCIRCQREWIDPESRKVALGHTCFAPVVYPASCSQGGYTQNVCDACGIEYKSDEVGVTGHVEFSKVVGDQIETMCVNCDHAYALKLVKVQPTRDEQIAYIGDAANLLMDASFDSGWTNCGNGNSIGSATGRTIGNGKLQFIPRYAKCTVKDATIGKYYEVEYTPQNCTNTDSIHAYMNLWNNTYSKHKGKTFIFEFSIRPNKFTFAQMTVQPIERFTKSPYSITALTIKENGDVMSGGSLVGTIDPTNTDKWTRIAIVLNTEEHTYSAYFNGVLVNTAVIDNIPTSFPYVQEWRVNIGTQDKKRTEPQGYDLDEVYSYIADAPLYITGLNRFDAAELEIQNATNDSEDKSFLETLGAGALRYTGKETWSVSDVTDTFWGDEAATTQKVIKYVKGATGAASQYIKEGNTGEIDVSDTHSAVSWVNLEFKLPDVTKKVDLMTMKRQFTEIITPDDPETEEVDETVSNITWAKDALVTVENGMIKVGDRTLCAITANKWTNISIVIHQDGDILYDVYVDGMLYLEGVEADAALEETKNLSGRYFGFFYTEAEAYEYYVSNLEIYSNVAIPDVFKGKLAPDASYSYDDVAIFEASQNFDVSTLVFPNYNAPGNFDIFKGEEDSFLSVVPRAATEAYAGYAVEKVGLNREIGEKAGENFVWTVRATNFKSSNAGEIFRIDNMPNVPATYVADDPATADVDESATYYDFTGFNKIKVRYFLAETDSNGTKLMLLFNCPSVDGKNCYFNYAFTVKTVGWNTLEVDLGAIGANNAADWTKVINFSIRTSGWSNGDGKGNAEDGTTLYLESIKFTRPDEILEGTGYITPDTPCEEHTFDQGQVVDPTCAVKGYTVKTCTVCGTKVVDTYVDALGHKYTSETVYTVDSTCENNGVKITKKTCSVCKDEEFVKDVTLAKNHKWVKAAAGVVKTCLTDGYDIYTCSNANCDYAEETEIRMIDVATGHVIKEGTVVVVAPKCEVDGYTEATCSVCNEKFQYDEVPAIGHKIQETNRKLPTCEAEGTIYKACANGCGKTEEEAIPARGHLYAESDRIPAANGVDGKIIYSCINEGCTSSYDVAIKAFPTAADMAAVNAFASFNGEDNKISKVGKLSGIGSATAGVTANFSTWTNKSDAISGSYIDVIVENNADKVSKLVLDVNNNSVDTVIEFNVKPNDEAFAGLNVYIGETKLISIATNGTVNFNGYKSGAIDVAQDVWNRFALVFNAADNTIDFFFNGEYVRSKWADDINVTTLTFAVAEDAKTAVGLSIDEIYAYAGNSPVYNTGNRAKFDDHEIDFDTDSYFNSSNQLNNSGSFNNGIFKKTKVVYKEDYELKREELTTVFYGNTSASTQTVLHLKKDASVKEYSTYEKNKRDSYMDVGDFMTNCKPNTVHFSMTIMFNEFNDNITLINGRRSGSATGWANAYLKVTNKGVIQFLSKNTSVTCEVGKWYKIDVYMDCANTYECALFVNDEFVTYNDGSSSVISQQYKDNTKDSVYRTLNVSNNTKEHDLYISDWDVNVDVKLPTIPA